MLVHALCDALLGAAGLPDIGNLFPDSDVEYDGIDSLILLKKVAQMLSEKDLKVDYADCTVVAQKPKMAPYIDKMKSTISDALGVPEGRLNVKATTEEKLGFTGALEGIAAHAVCILSE